MGAGHNHEPPQFENINQAFIIGIGLNALFTAIEFFMGFYYNSLALISDALHNLSDVGSLIISLVGLKLAQKAVKISYTYGYKKATILASLINAILLVVVVIGIIGEALERFSNPPDIAGMSIIIVASIGVVINTISAFLFFKGQKSDINIRGAFIHLMVDALVSVGVVVSGIIITYTGWNLIDPIISLVIAVVIILTTWELLVESIRLTIDAVPKDIDIESIKNKIEKIDGVEDFHHIHVWAMSSSSNALTAHVVIVDEKMNQWDSLKETIKHELHHLNIHHTTLELDVNHEDCITPECK